MTEDTRPSIRTWLAEVRKRPDTWFVYHGANTAAASHINKGKAYGAKPGEFTAASRFPPGKYGQTEGRCDLYVKCDVPGEPVWSPWPDWLIEKVPTGLHKIKAREEAETPRTSRSKMTDWLNDTVRAQTDGTWHLWDGPFHSNYVHHLKHGTMYGANKGEFEVKVETVRDKDAGTVTRSILVRVDADWIRQTPERLERLEAEAAAKAAAPDAKPDLTMDDVMVRLVRREERRKRKEQKALEAQLARDRNRLA
jgi:hypothetical protein